MEIAFLCCHEAHPPQPPILSPPAHPPAHPAFFPISIYLFKEEIEGNFNGSLISFQHVPVALGPWADISEEHKINAELLLGIAQEPISNFDQ